VTFCSSKSPYVGSVYKLTHYNNGTLATHCSESPHVRGAYNHRLKQSKIPSSPRAFPTAAQSLPVRSRLEVLRRRARFPVGLARPLSSLGSYSS